MDNLKMHSPNLTEENVARIRELFPSCVTEAKDEQGNVSLAVDFDQLRQELSDHIVEGPQERYQLNWPGKREALLAANAPIAKTLRPSRDESVAFDTTKNLFIEGDNLDALKLLQTSYLGAIKMIYIDPPYNTGKDFIYKDNYSKSQREYELESGQTNEVGDRLIANPETRGRYHSDWLSMMYSRLRVAKRLLRKDGAIFISIDEHELANLRQIADEIFGYANLVACLCVINNMKGRNDKANVATAHEYLLIYSAGEFVSRGIPLTDEQLKEYKYTDERGEKYALRDLRKRGRPDRREDRPNMYFPIFYHPESQECRLESGGADWIEITPKRGDLTDGRWRWGMDTVKRHLAILHAKYSRKNERWDIEHRVYLNPTAQDVLADSQEDDEEDDDDDNIQRTAKPKSFLWGGEISTDVASREFKKLFPGLNPDYPKSIFYLDKLVHMGSGPGDIVLDFFAGYSTTAHSVFRLAATGQQRRFILVQLDAPIDPKVAENKASYEYCKAIGISPLVSELSKERIRRAGQLVSKEAGDTSIDTGFRVLKIDSSNMADVYSTPDAVNQADLLGAVENVKPGRDNPEDLLFQVLVDWGVDLTLPIRQETLKGKTVFFVNSEPYDLIACFDKGVSEDLVKELAKHKPMRVVFRDNGFESDSVKINVDQIFRQLSPSTDVKSI
jgi:adenine-specific DNA-methyltransferase